MRFGLTISAVVHAALLAWALFTIQKTPELLAPQEEPIEVALIDPSEFLRLKKGATDVSELEAKAKEAPKPDQSVKEAEKPKPVEAEKAPAPAPAPEVKAPDPIAEKLAETPPAAPGPTPEEKKLLEEKIEQERLAEEKRKADEEAKKKAEEKKKADEKKKAEEKRKLAEQKRKEEEKKKEQSAADRLAALLDKDPAKRGAQNAAPDPSKPTDYTGRTAGANRGEDSVLAAREQDLLVSQIRSQIRDCWKLPGGGGGIESMVVVLSWRLHPDGTLDGEPMVIGAQSDPVYQIAVEAAVRAVKTCSPFSLPAEMYPSWKFIEEWRFDPREML